MKIKISVIAVLAAAAVLAAGCGAKSASSDAAYYEAGAYAPQEAAAEEYEYDTGMFMEEAVEMPAVAESAATTEMKAESSGHDVPEPEADVPADAGNADAAVLNRKLIKNVSMEVETEDLDQLDAAIESRTKAAGGYVESKQKNGSSIYQAQSVRRRYASYTLRIPADRIDAFVEDITGRANVLSQSSYVEDVTLHYVDTKSRISSLETQRDRLLKMLEAAENVEDMIYIESELSNVRYELENYASRLRLYDNQIMFATLDISVTEVTRLTDTEEPVTVGERIRKGISESFLNVAEGVGEFFIGLIIFLPYLLLLAFVAAVVVLVCRLFSRRRKAAREKRAEKKAARTKAAAAAGSDPAAAAEEVKKDTEE